MLSTSQSAAGPAPGQAVVQQLLGLPEVGGLAGKAGAVEQRQAGEGVGVVWAEVPEQPGVGVEAEVLADQFAGDDLAVGQEGGQAVLAEGIEVGGVQFIVYPAEGGKDKIVEGHGGTPWFQPV
jgi:hypothetical protein